MVCGQEKLEKGGMTVITMLFQQKGNRQTAATVRRRAAFRKTQTPSANSLTERTSERKKIIL